MRRLRPAPSIVAPLLLVAALGCSSSKRAAGPPPESPEARLQAAVSPPRLVKALRGLGGAHFTSTSTFRIAAPAGGASEAPEDAVTTTTEVRMDRHGHYRLVENNDRDGGREVVLHGKELAVALRYGKLVRRPAQEPEPTRHLEEAVGAPWAAWELCQRFATVESQDGRTFKITRSATPAPAPEDEGAEGPGPLRKWRGGVEVKTLEGTAEVAPDTGVLLAFDLKASFTLKRGEAPMSGEVAVVTKVDEIGSTPVLAAPLAEDLPIRQRTILEERALLGRNAETQTGAPAGKRTK